MSRLHISGVEVARLYIFFLVQLRTRDISSTHIGVVLRPAFGVGKSTPSIRFCGGTPAARRGRPNGYSAMISAAHGVTSGNKRLAWAFSVWYMLCGSFAFRAVNGKGIFQPSSVTRLESQECPESCKYVFLKLEDGPTVGGGKVQHVEVQERGEPKSGTGFMFEWAVGALAHSCMYLQSAYGGESCRIETSHMNRTLVFEPHLASKDPGPCACDDVDRVTITLLDIYKHTLPVDDDCNWSRRTGIALAHDKTCTPLAGKPLPQNKDELWECVKSSACRNTDDRLQMAVIRDPRAAVVSAYFNKLRSNAPVVKGVSVDEYVLSLFPIICQWVSIRYLLFSEILAATSTIFWYDDAMGKPIEWHQQLFSFVGLRIPEDVVLKAVAATAQGGQILGFSAKGVDEHPGGLEVTASRSYRDEVTAATLEKMDSELGVWLPAAVLEHIGVAA